MESDQQLNKYRVWMRSTPGFYEQYDSKVDVYAESFSEAEERAFLELKRGVFPDRGRSMWQVERVEMLRSGGC